jgi:hypothetical protein
MKNIFLAGFLMLATGFIPPAFGSLKDCETLHTHWPSVKTYWKNQLDGRGGGNLVEIAIFRSTWNMFLVKQSPEGPEAFENTMSEMNDEDTALFNYGMEIMIGNWLEENPDTTNLSADKCLFEALKEPLGLKELR